MKVGYAKANINPPLDAPIVGYYEPRFVKGYLDDLYVKVVAFDDGGNKALIITLDLCLLSEKYFNLIKERVVSECRVDKDSIFINLSHTHTGPTVGKDFASTRESSPEYDAFLIDTISKTAKNAFEDLAEGIFQVANSTARNISFVRRYRMKNGYVATNPGVGNPQIDYALAQPNESVEVVKILRKGKDDICLFNFGTHPDTIGGEYISADWMGYACENIEKALPKTNAVFLLGPQGDTNHVNVNPSKDLEKLYKIDFDGVPRGIEYTKFMAKVLSDAVLSVYDSATEIKADVISFSQKKISLPSNQENDRYDEAKRIVDLYYQGRADELPFKEMELTTAIAEARRIVGLKDGPESFPYVLSVLKIGELVFAGVGGEPFTEIGTRIAENSPFSKTIVCCLTNNSSGYIPTSKAYDEGGYEARGSSLKKGSDNILVEEMIKLLKSIQ